MRTKKFGKKIHAINKVCLFTISVFTLISIMFVANGYAFHEGGVGYCEGCHNLHSSGDDKAQGADNSSGNMQSSYMLKGADPSSTCLRCHAERGEFASVLSNDGSIFTPGGDFYWLKKTFTSNVNGQFYRSEGDNHGHNIDSIEYGLHADSALSSSPGGSYPSSAMSCTSCHDPHGKMQGESKAISVSGSYGQAPAPGTVKGNFRLLGGIGYSGGSLASGHSFVYSAPVAVASQKNWTETDSNHTAYGSGMSEWCSNCHQGYLSGYKHPSGNEARLSSVISNYNSYLKTGDFTGTQAGAYSSLVPFELGTSDSALLDPSSTSGPGAGGEANVMCLTCHRSHASAFQSMGRWDFKATFIADSHPGPGDSGVNGNDVLNSYYGRNMTAEFGKYQRQLCNKCHAMD